MIAYVQVFLDRDINMKKKSAVDLAKQRARNPRFLKLFLIISVFIGLAILFFGQEYKKIVEKFTPSNMETQQSYKSYDLGTVREKKVVNPRYIGVDDQRRPYVITADSGEHIENDLVKLDNVDAAMQIDQGESVGISAAHGQIDQLNKESKIQLSGGVTITHNGGYEAKTKTVNVNLATNTVNSHYPTNGSSPYGTWNSQGFELNHKKKTISLKGKSQVMFDEGEKR